MKALVLSGVKEIARRANVSIATVDRVLHNRSGVALKTKELIEAIIKDMDYKPNILAKRLASKRVHRFAVLIPQENAETDYWRALLNGIQSALNELGDFGVEISYYLFNQRDRTHFKELADHVLGRNLDAVIVAPVFVKETKDFVFQCEGKKIRYIFLQNDLPLASPLSYIGPDAFQFGRLAANMCKYLVEPHEPILVLSLRPELEADNLLAEKMKGFEDFLGEQGAAWNIMNLKIDTDMYEVFEAALAQYLENNKTNLIYVLNSQVFWVARFFSEHKIQDIKLIGYDYSSNNIKYLEKGYIDFLICQQPLKLGYRALATLFEHFIAKKGVSRTQYMPIDIVTKENFKLYKH